MKIIVLIARYLLGLAFLIFGLNGFLHFIPMPPPKGTLALQYLTTLGISGYMIPVFALQLVSAILLLAGRFVPLALVLLGPVLVNILLFHLLMAPEGLPVPIFLTVLWAVVAYWHRTAFAGLFQPRALTPLS